MPLSSVGASLTRFDLDGDRLVTPLVGEDVVAGLEEAERAESLPPLDQAAVGALVGRGGLASRSKSWFDITQATRPSSTAGSIAARSRVASQGAKRSSNEKTRSSTCRYGGYSR